MEVREEAQRLVGKKSLVICRSDNALMARRGATGHKPVENCTDRCRRVVRGVFQSGEATLLSFRWTKRHCSMKCERCGESMLEDQLSASRGMASLKNVSVLRCMKCGRLEYRTKDGIKVVTEAIQRSVSG